MQVLKHRLGFCCFVLLITVGLSCSFSQNTHCLTGAFIADSPRQQDIQQFKSQYGKKPHLIMLFLAWHDTLDTRVLADIYRENCAAVITLEPWKPQTKQGIDFDAIIAGADDDFIRNLAFQLKSVNKPVYLRFAHEMNGNWYPWSGEKVGAGRWIAAYRHIKDLFDQQGVHNVQWVFSINWQNIPLDNDWKKFYPGDGYVDYIGVDGYNWGNTQSWSHWMSFKDIFMPLFSEIKPYQKPVLITEFASADKGGDRAKWISEAMTNISQNSQIHGYVLFNVNKEVDWKLDPLKSDGLEFKKQQSKDCFKE